MSKQRSVEINWPASKEEVAEVVGKLFKVSQSTNGEFLKRTKSSGDLGGFLYDLGHS